MKFSEHWLYNQSYFNVFNANNSGAGIVKGEFYHGVLVALIVAGILTSMKRTWVALLLGRKTYDHYKHQLVSKTFVCWVICFQSQNETSKLFPEVASILAAYLRSTPLRDPYHPSPATRKAYHQL